MNTKRIIAALIACGMLVMLSGCKQTESLWESIEPATEQDIGQSQDGDGMFLTGNVQEPPADPYADDSTLVSEGVTDNGIRYAVYEQHVEITGHTMDFSEKKLTIPETIESKPVSRIASVPIRNEENGFEADSSGAFYDCYQLEEVIIPEGLTYIGDYAFCGCKNMVRATIPESVTVIGTRAFALCSKLKELNIPQAIDRIGDSAFSLTPWYDSLLFHHELIIFNGRLYDAGNMNNGHHNSMMEVPDYVVEICDGAFYGCKDISSIRIPASVKRIGERAFQECVNLQAVAIENPECEIFDAPSTFSNVIRDEGEYFLGVLYADAPSTAQKYAAKYSELGCQYDKLGNAFQTDITFEPPWETTTTDTTDVTTTTTTK